ncbi:MAG: 2-oxoacid:acceptor oxidoreductase family protein [candidate division WOR-3 bacterium]|nr:2-oxoacid:acceptor oxidoreductase family protein [candidate division WOR-3 bacterium]MCX7757570.1 2-oxoacid:acceptor oxidoreductase family protein [candidate division WOR-3 bacterium]MDW7987538.1 2-oxoacid:acceptor oxidoreductase family protein [candidate division WOR-3 bacterium]
MKEIRFHGRGGQGAVIASEILATALFAEGKYVQTFPEFGVERRGAPVQAFLRFDTKPILLRCKVYTPDDIVVLDPMLVRTVNITQGLKPNGWILLNYPDNLDIHKTLQLHPEFKNYRLATVDATKIAIKYRLGPKTAPIVNTAILGAFVRITNYVTLEQVIDGIKEYVPLKIDENIEATKEAYEMVREIQS